MATKGGYRPGEGRPEVLRAQIEQSLRSLRTEAIGLYYLHRIDPQTPLEESLGTIAEHVERGAIRHVGISAVGVEEIERARRVVPIAAVQNEYSIGDRSHDDVVDHCAAEGIAFVPYFPLRGATSREVETVAERHGVGTNAVKLAWLLQRSAGDGADPRHALARPPAREPRGARAAADRRRPGAARVALRALLQPDGAALDRAALPELDAAAARPRAHPADPLAALEHLDREREAQRRPEGDVRVREDLHPVAGAVGLEGPAEPAGDRAAREGAVAVGREA